MILTIVVRADINLGRQMAQVAHAAFEWSAKYGPHHGVIHVRGVASVDHLTWVAGFAGASGGRVAVWHEPDLRGRATALATDAEVADLTVGGRVLAPLLHTP